MQAPDSLAGKAAVAAGAIAAGGVAGAALAGLTKVAAADGTTVQKIPGMTGAIAGVLAASLAGSVYGEFGEGDGWEDTSRLAAVLGIGGLTAGMLLGLTKTFLGPAAVAAGASAPQVPAGHQPMTFGVTAADSGKTLSVYVGDAIAVTMVGGVWTWTVPSVLKQAADGTSAFVAVSAGTATLTGSSMAGTFTLHIVVSG